MFCPYCGDEFRDEVESCPDCGVDLVETAPPRPHHRNGGEETELFWTGDARFLVDAASHLRSAGIPFSVHGAERLAPDFATTRPQAKVARILVPEARRTEAEDCLAGAGLDPADAQLNEAEELIRSPSASERSTPPEPEPDTFLGRVRRVGISLLDLLFLWI